MRHSIWWQRKALNQLMKCQRKNYTGLESGIIGECTTSGATVSASLISGLENPVGIALGAVPEPSSGALAGVGGAALWLWRRRK